MVEIEILVRGIPTKLVPLKVNIEGYVDTESKPNAVVVPLIRVPNPSVLLAKGALPSCQDWFMVWVPKVGMDNNLHERKPLLGIYLSTVTLLAPDRVPNTWPIAPEPVMSDFIVTN